MFVPDDACLADAVEAQDEMQMITRLDAQDDIEGEDTDDSDDEEEEGEEEGAE